MGKKTDFFLDLFFPKTCAFCRKEREYLCQDCRAVLDVSQNHQKEKTAYLSDLYSSLGYENKLVKKLIRQFKYEPLVKGLAETLASLIIEHFKLLDKEPDFNNFILLAVPLAKKRLKWRGFNQAEEIAKHLSVFLGIPVLKETLVKTKETKGQTGLGAEQRKINIKDAFLIRSGKTVRGQKILLVDDVYTTGATLKECARVLKEAGAAEVVGVTAARAVPGNDK